MQENSTQVIDSISKALTPLAEKLNAVGQFSWGTVYYQQRLMGLIMIIISALSLISAIGLGFYLIRIIKKAPKELKGLVIISLCVFTLSFIFFLGQGVLHLVNPSFYSMQYFLQLIQP